MFRKFRGQGAMEYLMTYGWAILVVMIVGIVMWQLGIFNINQGSTTSTGFAKIKPQLAAVGLKSDGTLTAVFTNGAGARINIITTGAGAAITIDGKTPQTCSAIDFIPDSVIQGDNFRISASCPTGQPQEVYNARFTIPYSITIGGITTTHTEQGSIRGQYE